MKIALRACPLSSTLDSPQTPENFPSTAFHSPCNTIDDFILIFHKLKLVIPSNFGTSYFADDVDTLLDAISPQINAQLFARTRPPKNFNSWPISSRPSKFHKEFPHGHKS